MGYEKMIKGYPGLNLRHGSLQMNVLDTCSKFHPSIINIKGDILGRIIKVKKIK